MVANRFATIDVGTNAVLLLVVEREPTGAFRVLADRTEITRLGRGVDATRRLAPASIAGTAEVIERYAAEARSLGVQSMACVATSAARDAENGAEFFAAVQARAGLVPEILSGDEEARMSYLAAERDFGPGPKVVIDIGGGSTEFIYGDHGRISYQRSFDLGSVRLGERFMHSDPPSSSEREAMCQAIDEAFSRLPTISSDTELVGVAGTVTTVFTVRQELPVSAGGGQAHGQHLNVFEVDAVCEQLWRLSLEQRLALPGLHPKRADVIPAGVMLLSRAMHRLSAELLTISDRGVRWGLLYSRFGSTEVS
jgi:exopolyphosphatase/guanosine-5'-triphosphate,3'-diphosphate pyrophosphatase